MNEKWILTVPREIHLGFIKETFGRGAVIELDEDRGLLIVDGRKFDDTRDLELLQRQAIKNPNTPWVMPFSEELLAEIKGITPPVEDEPVHRSRPGDGMPIVEDDSTDHPPIDIRHTQVSKTHQAEKEAQRAGAHRREVDRKMEIVRGDESPEERRDRIEKEGGESPVKIPGEATESRIRKLEQYMADRRARNKPTDLTAQSELVALKRRRAHMPIVQDDSLGMGIGRNEIPMNAGQHLPSREEAEAKKAEKQAEAELRKKHVEMTRRRAGVEVPGTTTSSSVDQDIPPELEEATEVLGGTESVEVMGETDKAVTGQEMSDADVAALEADMEQEASKQSEREAALEAENDSLRAQNAELKNTQEAIMARLEKLESNPPRRKPGRPKGSKDKTPRKKPKTATKLSRTPVESE